MKKLGLIFGMIVFTFSMNAQVENNNGEYTEVIEVELSKKDIHQKVNEWIATNYNSAQDVVQLNTEDKVIVKGNYVVLMQNISYRVYNSLSFSIRDNKYKVDLIPSGLSTSTIKKNSGLAEQIIEIYAPKKLDENEYNEIAQRNGINYLKALGWSDKKIQNKFINKGIDEIYYTNYLDNKVAWDKAIESTFKSIKEYINQSNSDDDW